jgi:hypothetical protein
MALGRERDRALEALRVARGPGTKIALVRHGRSAHTHSGWIDCGGYEAWRNAYEAAGVHEDERVPRELAELVAESKLVVASDAPRAVESARLLSPDREVFSSPLLRELELRPPDLGKVRLPLSGWAVAIALYGRVTRADLSQIDKAATWLSSLALRETFVVAVTHGWVRQVLAKTLIRSGWQVSHRRWPVQPWSVWLLLKR